MFYNKYTRDKICFTRWFKQFYFCYMWYYYY